MDKCCGNCRWWDGDNKQFYERAYEPGYQVCLYVLHPGNEKEKLGSVVDDHPPCGILEKGNRSKWDEHYTKMTEAKSHIAVHSMDASNYWSVVSTCKDHYCSAWEPEEQTINIKERVRNMAKLSASMEEFCVGKIGKENPDG